MKITFNQTNDIFKSKFVISIVVLDLLMFPYLKLLHCSIGMIIVAIWALTRINKTPLQTVAAAVFVIISLLNGIFFYKTRTTGITQAVIFIYIFFLYNYFAYCEIGKLNIIKKLLFVYLLFVGIMSALYMVAPGQYFSFRQFWTMSGTEISFTELMISRYTHIFSDPNNAGCVLLAVLAYLLVYENLSPVYLFICSAICCLSIFVTFSVSANAQMMALLVVYYCLRSASKNQKRNKKLLLFFIALVIIFVILNISLLFDNQLVETLLKRISINSNNGLGGRVEIWTEMLERINPLQCLLWGRGLVIDSAGIVYQPHNGILVLIYSYGILTTILFCKKFFSLLHRKYLYYLPYIPIALNIFINSGFADYRFITLSVLIISLMHTRSVQGEEK